MNTAAQAIEIQSNIGQDIDLAFELAQADTDAVEPVPCPNCRRPKPEAPKVREVVRVVRGRVVRETWVGPYRI